MYDELRFPNGRSVGTFVESLSRLRKKAIKRTDEVHLDPDLLAYPRIPPQADARRPDPRLAEKSPKPATRKILKKPDTLAARH
jgi:hypothetical protein